MTKQPYTPKPGTIPHRVIEHLRTLPAGAALSLGEILDALDCSSRHGFGPCMRLSREAGLVKSEPLYIGSSALYWSLGDGTPYIAPQKSDENVPLTPKERKHHRISDALNVGLTAWGEDDTLPPKELKQFADMVSVAELEAAQTRIRQLCDLVRRAHKAKGRYHTQLAICDLYEAVGLPFERPNK